MIYFNSQFHDKKVRIDTDKDKAYILSNGKETEAPSGSKIVADAIIEGEKISESEYK